MGYGPLQAKGVLAYGRSGLLTSERVSHPGVVEECDGISEIQS